MDSTGGAAEAAGRVAGGDVRSLARLITGLENGDPAAAEVMRALSSRPRKAHVVGITGPPGAGKSTLSDKLITTIRKRGLTVGVLAVDPSSPFTGGAILGDRLRMQDHATDPGVYIRSLASRGHLGGISRATQAAARALDAAGYDIVLIETVGVGQSEVDVVRVADTVALVAVPGLGDDIQVIKAGIMEIGDIFVVNKADRDGADRVVREIRAMLETAAALKWGQVPERSRVDTLAGRAEGSGHHAGLGIGGGRSAEAIEGEASPGDGGSFAADVHARWAASMAALPPVVKTVAETGEGVEALFDLVAAHRASGEASGRLAERRIEGARAEIVLRLQERMDEAVARGGDMAGLAKAVAQGSLDAWAAAEEIFDAIRKGK
jgi:LAO/AO transport system kinase